MKCVCHVLGCSLSLTDSSSSSSSSSSSMHFMAPCCNRISNQRFFFNISLLIQSVSIYPSIHLCLNILVSPNNSLLIILSSVEPKQTHSPLPPSLLAFVYDVWPHSRKLQLQGPILVISLNISSILKNQLPFEIPEKACPRFGFWLSLS